MNLRVASFGRLRGLTLPYLALAAASLLALAGAGAVIEMTYHLQMDAAMGGEMKYLGLALDAKATGTWAAALAVLVVGAALFEAARRHFARRWGDVQEQIEAEIRRRGGVA